MSGKDKAVESNNRRTDTGSLRGSVSDSSLEVEPEASPQSFAALKAAYDFMIPQYKALQTENRSLHKEKEELLKRLTDKETPSLDMSTYSQGLPADDLRSKGHAANRTLAVPSPEEQGDTFNGVENGEICRVSPCGGMDSAINLNDSSSFLIEKGVRDEREKWLSFSFQLLLYVPEDKIQHLSVVPRYCLQYCEEYASRINHPGSDSILTKLGKLKTLNGSQVGNSQMKMPQDPVGYPLGLTDPHGDMDNARGSPMGKSLTGTSDEDPSDEDIYTSGLPGSNKRRGRKLVREDQDDDDDQEWVRVDNAVGILEKCASYIHQSLEAHTLLMKKLEENQKNTEFSRRSRSDDTIGSYYTTSPPDLPPPPLPNRTNPPVAQLRPSPRRIDHIRQHQQFPSAASDPGRASSALSQLTLEKQFFSDPVTGEHPRYSSPKKARRPRSVAEIPTPLQELSVKYPPLPYGVGSSYSSRNYVKAPGHTPPDFIHHSPVTIDQNSFQFDDGHTYNPCGPPEGDFRQPEAREEDDIYSWTAARNPEIDQPQPASPPRFPRSDPSKRFVPSSSDGFVGDSYGQRQLPRSSDRIYEMSTPTFSQFDTLTAAGFSEPSRSTKGTEVKQQPVTCPVCDKKFDPGTPDVARYSHVNLHFENERNTFEIIE